MNAHNQPSALSLLVIEDDDVDLEKIKRLLHSQSDSIRLTEAMCANSALALLASNTFDCAIVDYRLKDGLGSELLNRIKHHKKIPTPVIMVSGNSDERVVADVMREGAFDYIPKRELNAETLKNTINASITWAKSVHQQQQDQARFHHLAEGLPHLAWTCLPNGSCDYLNKRWCDYTGITQAEQMGEGWLKAVHPDDRENLLHHWKKAVAAQQELFIKFRIRGKDGSYRWFDTRAVPQKNEQGEVLRWLGTNTDITEIELTRQALAYSEQLFHAAFDYAPLGMALINLHGLIMQTNPALEQMLGYREEVDEDGNKNNHRLVKIADLLAPDEITVALLELEKLHTDERNFVQYETYCQIHSDDQIHNRAKIPVMINAAYIDNFSGEPCFLLQIYDLSERKRYEQQLIRMAHFDSLTGLGNREKMNREMDFLLRKSRRSGAPFAVIFGDLDHFKEINDSLGHEAGDLVLKTIARRLQKSLRHEDIICRLGGDEFVILLTDIPRFEAVASVANKLVEKTKKPMRLGSKRKQISMSFGIALYPTDGDDAKSLLRNADSALYNAKGIGRGCYQLYRKELTEYVHNRLQLDTDLRQSITNNEFELHYQPIVNMTNQTLVAAQAVIRWHHPERGLVAPEDFIPFARESDLILSIGDWILNQACQQLAQWRAMGRAIPIAFEVSARQFNQQDLPALFEKRLIQYNLPGEQIIIETTEQVFLENTASNLEKINRLKAIGIQLVLKNFGTRYSSLRHLLLFSPHFIKLDPSAINLIGSSKAQDEMVRTLVELNKIMPLEIVGDGIETQHQADFLQSHGCKLGQGSLFSVPIQAEELCNNIQYQALPLPKP